MKKIKINEKKKYERICNLVDFAVQLDKRGKINESEKIDKYLDLRELKKKYGTVKFAKHCGMIDSCWTQGQSETMALIGWFQSGD